VSVVRSAYRDIKSAARQHVVHSMKWLKTTQHYRKRSIVDLIPKSVSLSKKEYYRGNNCLIIDKKTVVFDLDETLVHCNESLDQPYDIKIPITFPKGGTTETGVNIRPYARELLQNLSVNF
jgi:CTD small phosphatase-like protein 2